MHVFSNSGFGYDYASGADIDRGCAIENGDCDVSDACRDVLHLNLIKLINVY